MRQSEGQNRLNAQLFVRVGKDRYAPIKDPAPGEQLYIWDQQKHRIVPLDKIGSTL